MQNNEAGEKKIITVELTPEERSYLIMEMNMLLRNFRVSSYGGCYTNPDMGSAFNKIFKALTGENHINASREKIAEVAAYHNAKTSEREQQESVRVK